MEEDIEKARARFVYANVMKLTMTILTIVVSVLLVVTSSTTFDLLIVAALLIVLKLHNVLFKLLVKNGYYGLASMKESEEIIGTRSIICTTGNTAFRWDTTRITILVVYGFAAISWIVVLILQWNGSIAFQIGNEDCDGGDEYTTAECG